MAKHYYAAYSPYGERTVFNDANYGKIYVFDNREDRDKYVAHERSIENELNYQTFSITSEEFRNYKKNCEVFDIVGHDHLGYIAQSREWNERFHI